MAIPKTRATVKGCRLYGHVVDADPIDPTVMNAVRACIVEVVGVAPQDVQPNTTLDALGADSFHRIHLALHLEKQFGVTGLFLYDSSRDLTLTDYAKLVAAALAAVSASDL